MTTLATLAIPLTTLNGQQVFGPVAIPSGVTWVKLSINRNVGATPLNGDPTLRMTLTVDVSLDNGQTWQFELGATAEGGIVVVRGVQQNVTSIMDNPIAGDLASNTRQARATVTTNAPISISGSMTLGS